MAELNFWDFLVMGFNLIIGNLFLNRFPDHETIGLAIATVRMTTTALGVLTVVVFSYINMTMPILALTVALIGEPSLALYGIWRFVKKTVI
jgi:hypothetical protein